MINWINELVNKDGVRLGDDNVKLSVDNSKSASNSTIDPMYNPETGDQLKNATAQQRQQGYRKFPWSLVPMPARTAGATSYMDDTEDVIEKGKEKWPKKGDKKQPVPPPKHTTNPPFTKNPKEKLKEASRKKMEEYVEDIISKKNISKDVLSKNGIPDVDNISEDNPVLVRKVKSLIDIISKNQATGEQKGMILNYLISNIGTTDIPIEYKQEMVKKLR